MRRVGCWVLLLTSLCLVATWWASGWPFGAKGVRICRAGGEPIMGAVLILRRPGAPEPDFSDRTNNGSGWLRIPRDRIRDGAEMLVVAPGCALVRGDLPWGFRILLPEGLRVTFRVEGDFKLPERPSVLRLHLKPADVEPGLERALEDAVVPPGYWDWDFLYQDGKLDVDPLVRTVTALVPCAGRWNVHWSVQAREVRDGGTTWSGSGPSEGIPVEIRGSHTTVALAIDPKALREHGGR